MNIGHSIVGFSNQRADDDFYPTPPHTILDLYRKEKFEGNVWECACGDGSLSKVIKQYNECYSSDLVDRGYGDSTINFLTYGGNSYDNIITNPPYSEALEFVKQSKQFAKKKIAMFLKTTFLESNKRKGMFLDTHFPLKAVYQYSKRVPLYRNGIGKGSSMVAYAWFVWDKDYSGKPFIDWI